MIPLQPQAVVGVDAYIGAVALVGISPDKAAGRSMTKWYVREKQSGIRRREQSGFH